MAHHQEQRGEAVHALFEQGLDRFRRDVAAGEAGAAGGDDDVDGGVRNPVFDARTDLLDVVAHDRTGGNRVAGFFDPLDQRGAGLVVGQIAGVGHRQHGNLQRYELPGCVDSGHDALLTQKRQRAGIARLPVGI